MRGVLLAGVLAVAAAPVATASADLTESFDSWPPSGWTIQNNSSPLGANAWYAGIPTTNTPDPGPFNAYNGAANAYAAANFANTTGGNGTISSWFITPLQTGLTQGDTVSFYTRRPTIPPGGTEFPDRLEVRMSTNGACSPGTTTAGVGDFTTELVTVNPTQTTGVYPATWTQFSVTLPPMAPASGCIAFRYHVTQAGPSGSKSDYIGVDQVEIRDQPDNVTPDTSISGGPTGATNDASPTFTYAGSPSAGVGSYECRLTPSGETPATFSACPNTGRSYSNLSDGTYDFEVRAVSHGGNVDPTPASRSFTVDTTPPATTITSGPSGTIATDEVTFTFVGEPSDDVAGFECRLRSSNDQSPAFENCDSISETSYGDLADGAYTFEVRAYDDAGNIETTPASREFTVDATAPDTAITSGPSGTIGAGDVTFTYEGIPAEDTDRFECRLRTEADDDPVFASCPDVGKTYSGLGDGDYVFEVRAIDAVDNTDMTPASRAFTVDATAPTVEITSGPEASSTATDASFAFTATPEEDVDRVECRLVGPGDPDPAFAECAGGARSFTGLALGEYRFELRARDAVGNVSETVTRSFRVVAPGGEPGPGDPTPPGGPAAPGNPTTPDGPTAALAPKLGDLRLTRSTFRAWRRGPSFGRVRKNDTKAGRGARLRLRVDRAVRLELRIARASGKRWKAVPGRVRTTLRPGVTTLSVRGRFVGKTLRPGRYRLTLTAIDRATGKRTPATVRFRIRG